MTNTPTTNGSVEVLARRRLSLLEQKEAVESEIKNVDAQIIDAIEIFRVAQKRDFRVDLAEKVLPAEVITACTVTVEQIDKAKLKSYAEAMGVIDACLKTSVPFVSAVKR